MAVRQLNKLKPMEMMAVLREYDKFLEIKEKNKLIDFAKVVITLGNGATLRGVIVQIDLKNSHITLLNNDSEQTKLTFVEIAKIYSLSFVSLEACPELVELLLKAKPE